MTGFDCWIMPTFRLASVLNFKIQEIKIMKYIIVGAVAGGASAAARLRRLDEHAEIIIFEKVSIFLMQIAGCHTISVM